ncbi:MAG: hypothetical protein V1929_12535 [bacterium]
MNAFILQAVRAQVRAVLQEIDRLEGSEFPYLHAKDGLDAIRDIFREHEESLGQLTDSSKPDTVENACKTAFATVEGSLDILGFILRSTNVRNGFEVYGPLLRLCRQVMGSDSKLIVSSEWSFSPFTLIGYEHLPGFVLIGLPATESANPFLIPLAGHELGHSVWSTFGHDVPHRLPIEDHIVSEIQKRWSEYETLFPGHERSGLETDFFTRQTWQPARAWAMRQAEESYCDFLGLRIFGEAYLYAAAYLIAPFREGRRPLVYPNHRDRAQALTSAADEYGLTKPADYVGMFADLAEPKDDQKQIRFLLSLADSARGVVLPALIKQAKQHADDALVPVRDPAKVKECARRMALMVPVQRAAGLANIMNAAWQARLSESQFFSDPGYDEHRESNLSEIVLKSLEVFEIEQKLASGP